MPHKSRAAVDYNHWLGLYIISDNRQDFLSGFTGQHWDPEADKLMDEVIDREFEEGDKKGRTVRHKLSHAIYQGFLLGVWWASRGSLFPGSSIAKEFPPSR
jgi:hypothetical protein